MGGSSAATVPESVISASSVLEDPNGIRSETPNITRAVCTRRHCSTPGFMASLATDLFSQLLAHVSLLLHSHRLQPFRGAQCEEDDLLTHSVCISALLESLPPEIDLRSMTDPGTPS